MVEKFYNKSVVKMFFFLAFQNKPRERINREEKRGTIFKVHRDHDSPEGWNILLFNFPV